jgi:hypothetical protein
MKAKRYLFILLACLIGLLTLGAGISWAKDSAAAVFAPQAAVGTGFTYQGQLNNGEDPAEGVIDFQFQLYDAEENGTLLGTVALEDVTVTEGLFAVKLDFGDVYDGNERWLAISVRPGDEDGAYAPLIPRQGIDPAPYALYAVNAGSVDWADVQNPPAGLADGDNDTQYAAGFGLELDNSTFNVTTDTVQARVTGTCAPGSMVTAINADGSVVCETDDNTTYSAGAGLDLDSTTFNVTTDTVQARVSGECAVGSTIRAVKADGDVECTPDAPLNRNMAPADNISTTLDSQGIVGQYTSITIGADGLPIISYYNLTNDDLKVAHCDDVECTSAISNTLDSQGNVGEYTSIAIGADGLPIISYFKAGGAGGDDNLKVAHCNDLACTSASIQQVDTPWHVGEYTSIAIGADGLPIISYFKAGGANNLKVAHCDDVECTSSISNTLDSQGVVGWYTSIAIGADGLPIISYYKEYGAGDDCNLKVAHCDDVMCTSAISTTLDSQGDVGWDTSIAIGADGLPIISYYKAGGAGDEYNLKVAHCDDVMCTSAISTTLDSQGVVGWSTSITIGADGLPIISYYKAGSAKSLRVAHCNDLACTSASIQPVDTPGDVGHFTSITIGADGLPIISYFDYTKGNLKVLHCSNPFCVPYFKRR